MAFYIFCAFHGHHTRSVWNKRPATGNYVAKCHWILHIKPKHFLPSGDDGSGTGLQTAPAHGLSHGAAPADARVLDEGEKSEAQVLTHRQHPGQIAPQRRQPQGGDQHLLRVSSSQRTPLIKDTVLDVPVSHWREWGEVSRWIESVCFWKCVTSHFFLGKHFTIATLASLLRDLATFQTNLLNLLSK